MSALSNDIETIKTARYGRDMRTAMASALEILASGNTDLNILIKTESEYSELAVKDPNTLYVVIPDTI